MLKRDTDVETDAQVVRDEFNWATESVIEGQRHRTNFFRSLDRILAELAQVKAELDALLEDETWHEETIAALRTENEGLRDQVHGSHAIAQRVMAENERYREALEQIAYLEGDPPLDFSECRVIARAALSPTTQEDR